MRLLLFTAAILAAFSLLSAPASAQQLNLTNCTDRASALSYLSKAYKEQPVAVGLASSGGVVEVLTNEGGTSWSIIVTLPSGVTCLVAAGEDWQPIEVKPGKES